MADESPIIMGIDPGIGHTGVGFIRAHRARPRYIYDGAITTKKAANRGVNEDIRERALFIAHALDAWICSVDPTILVVEEFSYNPNAAGAQRAAISTPLLLGVILDLSRFHCLEYIGLQARSIRKLVHGHAGSKKRPVSKADVAESVRRHLDRKPKNHHSSDALAAAIAGAAVWREGKLK
ncbi:unnamed protein product [marine sediment metagenome]|uniref:Uncharacterized protein n=1 Tax=marine sediment metagenome TaxID=412755 RepID=X0SCZ5_9ZZZZ